MTLDELEAQLEGSEAQFLEPRAMFDTAIIGIAERVDGIYVVANDCERLLQALTEAHGWDEEEAREWYEFNTTGAWRGPGTPVFIQLLELSSWG